MKTFKNIAIFIAVLISLILPYKFAAEYSKSAYEEGKKGVCYTSFWLPKNATIITDEKTWKDTLAPNEFSESQVRIVEFEKYKKLFENDKHFVLILPQYNNIQYRTPQGKIWVRSERYEIVGCPLHSKVTEINILDGGIIEWKTKVAWGWVIIGGMGGIISGIIADIVVIFICFLLFCLGDLIRRRYF